MDPVTEYPKCEECRWKSPVFLSGKRMLVCANGESVYAAAEQERMEGICGPTGLLFEKREPKQEGRND